MKWYVQIGLGLAALIAIMILNEAIYPESLFPTQGHILNSGSPGAFYTMAVLAIVAQAVILIGMVRGLLALARKFRGFVRINK